MQKIPITAYVERFLHTEFGPGPYYLDQNQRHPLRLDFLSVEAHGSGFLTVHTLGSVHVHIADSVRLSEFYRQNEARFDRGVFGLNLFFTSLYAQVSATAPYTGSIEESLRVFLRRYGISEEDYSLDNARRQYLRLKKARSHPYADRPDARVVGVPAKPSVAVSIAPESFRLKLPFFSGPLAQKHRRGADSVWSSGPIHTHDEHRV